MNQFEINNKLDEIKVFDRYLNRMVARGDLTRYYKKSIYSNFCKSLVDNFTMQNINDMQNSIKYDLHG